MITNHNEQFEELVGLRNKYFAIILELRTKSQNPWLTDELALKIIANDYQRTNKSKEAEEIYTILKNQNYSLSQN